MCSLLMVECCEPSRSNNCTQGHKSPLVVAPLALIRNHGMLRRRREAELLKEGRRCEGLGGHGRWLRVDPRCLEGRGSTCGQASQGPAESSEGRLRAATRPGRYLLEESSVLGNREDASSSLTYMQTLIYRYRGEKANLEVLAEEIAADPVLGKNCSLQISRAESPERGRSATGHGRRS
jgi:hypothetical protein